MAPPLGRELARVLEQIPEHLLEPNEVAAQPAALSLQRNGEPLALGLPDRAFKPPLAKTRKFPRIVCRTVQRNRAPVRRGIGHGKTRGLSFVPCLPRGIARHPSRCARKLPGWNWRQRRKPCGEGNDSLTQKQADDRTLCFPAQLECKKCPSRIAQLNNGLRKSFALSEPTMGFAPMTC